MNSGKFNTTIKTKISTPNGNILKITHYRQRDEEEPCDEYKILPKCSICGDGICVCYNDDNSDDPLKDATEGLLKQWYCEKSHCICEFMKTIDEDRYKELVKKYCGDECAICEALQEEIPENDDGIFCEV
jgi:hypothetical protein